MTDKSMMDPPIKDPSIKDSDSSMRGSTYKVSYDGFLLIHMYMINL